MKTLLSYTAIILATVITSVAAFVVADSVRFFVPGVPYSTQVHQGLACGAMVSMAVLVDLGACLTIFLCGRDTSHNPQG